MTERYDILIQGAGMVGSAAACLLAESDFTIGLISDVPLKNTPIQFGQAYTLRVSAINRASQRLFESIGIWDTLRLQRIATYTKMQVWDANSAAAISFDASEHRLSELGHVIENEAILYALHARLRQHSNITVLQAGTLSHLSYEKNDVTAHYGQGTFSAHCLIAADGGDSSLRKQAKISSVSSAFQQLALVTQVKVEKPAAATMLQVFTSTGPLGLLPLDDGQYSIVWSQDTHNAAHWLNASTEAVAAELARLMPELGAVELMSELKSFPLLHMHADSYIGPRLALIGDAAHRTHPLAGLGANMGFMDAAALADVLIQAKRKHRCIGSVQTLRKYERWRRPANREIMWAMQAFKTGFSSDASALKLLRSGAMRLVHASPLLKNTFINHALGHSSSDTPSACQTAHKNT